MKKSKRNSMISLLIPALFLPMVLTGCTPHSSGVVMDDPVGNSRIVAAREDDAKEKPSDATMNEAIGNVIRDTDGVVELTVWASEEDQSITQKIIDDFETAYSMISFDITLGCESEGTVKNTVMEDPEGCADVFTFADDQINDLVDGGLLAEIDEGYTYDISKSNIPASVEAATVDGKLYAYPMTADNGYFLFYNRSVFSDNDVKSLDKMIEKADDADKKIGMHIANGWYLYSFFKGAGFDLSVDKDGTNKCNWNDEGGTDVAKAVLDAVRTGVFVNMDDASMLTALEEDSVAALISGTWRAADVQAAWGNDYAACKLPTVKIAEKDVQMASFSGCKLIGVNPNAKNLDWAKILAEYLTNENSQIQRYKARLLGPSNNNARMADEIKEDPAIAALSAQSEFACPQRVGVNYWNAASELGSALSSSRTKDSELQKLLDKAVEGITAPPDNGEE